MLLAFLSCSNNVSAEESTGTTTGTESGGHTYLSDISYEDSSFATSNHSIRKDKNEDNKMITLILEYLYLRRWEKLV